MMKKTLTMSALALPILTSAYYPSIQEVVPGFQNIFPNLPSIPLAPSFDDPLAVDLGSLVKRIFEASTATANLVNPVTFGNETRPAINWMKSMSETGFDNLPLSEHRHVESCEQFFLLGMSAAKYAAFDKEKMAEICQVFTNSTIADNLWFRNIQQLISFNSLDTLVKFTKSDMYLLRSILGDEAVQEIQPADRDLYYMNVLEQAAFPPHVDGQSNVRYAVGAFVLLEKVLQDNEPMLKPIAIQIAQNQGTGGIQSRVLTKQSSEESAWRLGLLLATSSFTQWGVISHVYGYHVQCASFARSFANNILPDHPLYIAMKPWLRYNMQFVGLVLGNELKLKAFPFENDAPGLQNFMPAFSNWEDRNMRMPFNKNRPREINSDQDISNRFINELELKNARLSLDIEKATRKLAHRIINAIYEADEDVANDDALQAFFDDTVSSNLNGVTATGELQTKEDLYVAIKTYLYLSLIHGAARASVRESVSNVPCQITSVMKADFVSDGPETTYSLEDMLSYMPDTNTIGNANDFTIFFEYSTPYDGNKLIDNVFEDRELQRIYSKFLTEVEAALLARGFPEEEIDIYPLAIAV